MNKVIENIKKSTKWRQSLIEYGTATLLIAVVVWFVVSKNINFTNQEIKEEVKSTNTTVSNLQKQIDSVMMFQNMLVQRTIDLENSQNETNRLIEKGNGLLYQNKLAIEKIRLEYNEKINNVSNLNYRELDSLFSNRYPGY